MAPAGAATFTVEGSYPNLPSFLTSEHDQFNSYATTANAELQGNGDVAGFTNQIPEPMIVLLILVLGFGFMGP